MIRGHCCPRCCTKLLHVKTYYRPGVVVRKWKCPTCNLLPESRDRIEVVRKSTVRGPDGKRKAP